MYLSNGLSINSTILDLLEKKQITWKVYVENYDSALNYTNNSDLAKRYLVSNPILGIPRFVDNATLNSKIQDLTKSSMILKIIYLMFLILFCQIVKKVVLKMY